MYAAQLTNDGGFCDFENEYEILTVQIPLARSLLGQRVLRFHTHPQSLKEKPKLCNVTQWYHRTVFLSGFKLNG